jgi:NAD(P)-dependent dehydrogenase (short-subunit alcohol dehydrogenase family)
MTGQTNAMKPVPDHGEKSYRGSGRLADKKAIITGADSGIGRAVAIAYAREGADVLIAYLSEHDDAKQTESLVRDAGRKAVLVPGDIQNAEHCRGIVEKAMSELGGIDILVNNAARSIRRGLAESLERWHDVERVMALNYYGPLRLIRGLAPGMLARGDGHIINVATWGVMSEASPMFSVYNASKAALSSISRVAETEWGRKGVHSTTLYYPLVATPMIKPTKAYDGMPALTPKEAAEWMVTAARTRPVRIAPRMAVALNALNTVGPRFVNSLMQRRGERLSDPQ